MFYKIIEKIMPGGIRKGKRAHVISFSHTGRTGFQELREKIRAMYRITPGDTVRFSYALMGAVREELLQGKSVEVEGLGSFSLSVTYDSQAEHPGNKLNRNSIREVKIQFRPCKKMKIDKEEIKFVKNK